MTPKRNKPVNSFYQLLWLEMPVWWYKDNCFKFPEINYKIHLKSGEKINKWTLKILQVYDY